MFHVITVWSWVPNCLLDSSIKLFLYCLYYMSFRDICVFNVFFVYSRERSQFVLLLCSTQDYTFLITLLLTLIIIGKWSEYSSRFVLIEKNVLCCILYDSKANYIFVLSVGQYVGTLSDVMSNNLLIVILWNALPFEFASLDLQYCCLTL